MGSTVGNSSVFYNGYSVGILYTGYALSYHYYGSVAKLFLERRAKLRLGSKVERRGSVVKNKYLRSSPPNLSTISTYAFNSCSVLERVYFPILKSLSTNVFQNCKALTYANLGNINSLGGRVFYNCNALTDVYLGYKGLVNLANVDAFGGVTAGLKIHVRPEYADQYTNATNWSSLIENGTIVIVGDYKEE